MNGGVLRKIPADNNLLLEKILIVEESFTLTPK